MSEQQLSKKENALQMIKFAVFSASAGVIQIVSFALLTELSPLEEGWCYFISLTLSVLFNFTVNRRFTFKSANNVPVAMLKVAGFYLVFSPLSTWCMAALTKIGWNKYFVEAIIMLSNFVLEYLFCRFVVYRNSMNTREEEQKNKN